MKKLFRKIRILFDVENSLAFNLKEGPVRCAKVCDKSWVILLYSSLIFITVSQAETTTHRIPAKIFKPYPAINKPTFHHHHKKHPEGITIIQAAKVVEITTEKPKPKSIKFTYELLDRYYKDGWKEKDVKNSRNIPVPDFLKFAVPMEKSQRRMDVKYVYLDE